MSNLILPRSVKRAMTVDGLMTFDANTIDSTGAFLVGELERLDPMLYEPLVDIKWSRDIDLRSDVSIADEVSSFTNSSFAAVGGVNPTGKAWIGKDATEIANLALDIGKTSSPLTLWGMELGYTIPELESAQRLGRPVDSQKLEGIQMKHQMDIDEQVYIGDTLLNKTGLTNNAAVVTGMSSDLVVPADGTGSSTLWSTKTPDQILRDVNRLLTDTWKNSAYAIVPQRLLLPPAQYAYIVSQKVSTAGNVSIMKFLQDNSITLSANGRALEIYPSKWLTGRGSLISSVASDRMVAYSKEQRYVRFPYVPLQRTPLQYRSIYHLTTYFGRLGVVEIPRLETVGYADGI